MEKKLAFFALVVFALFACVPTLEAHGANTYIGKLSGVECNDCKTKIAKSFSKKKGVKEIRIKKIGDDLHQVTVECEDNVILTRIQANSLLGKGNPYKLVSWGKGHTH